MRKLKFYTSLDITKIISEKLVVAIGRMAHMFIIFFSWFLNGLLIYITRRYIIKTYEWVLPGIHKCDGAIFT